MLLIGRTTARASPRPEAAAAASASSSSRVELLGRGGVAAQLVVDLARAVVVAGAGDDQAEPLGERAQLGRVARVVVLVVDLDAGQPALAQPGQAALVERTVVVTPRPRVRQDR